jgi:hypothetical protein
LEAAAEFFKAVFILWLPKLQIEITIDGITMLIVTTLAFL